MQVVPLNPTYDSFWRSVAHSIFFREAGFNTGFGMAPAFKDDDDAGPFAAHPTPEHAVQLILARWLRFYAAFPSTTWTNIRGLDAAINEAAGKDVVRVVSSHDDMWQTPKGDKPLLAIASPAVLVRFLARWYGAAIVCVYGRDGVRDVNVTEEDTAAVVAKAERYLAPPDLVSLPQWKLYDPAHGAIPLEDVLAAASRVAGVSVRVGEAAGEAVPVLPPSPDAEPDARAWERFPPSLDVRIVKGVAAASPEPLGQVSVPSAPDADAITLATVEGVPAGFVPVFDGARLGPWPDRPVAARVVTTAMHMLYRSYKSDGAPDVSRDAAAVARAMCIVIPFLASDRADTMVLRYLTTRDGDAGSVATAATGASSATVRAAAKRVETERRAEEGGKVEIVGSTAAIVSAVSGAPVPSWFPSDVARLEGLTRRSFTMVTPVETNFGRAVHLLSDSTVSVRAEVDGDGEDGADVHPPAAELEAAQRSVQHLLTVVEVHQVRPDASGAPAGATPGAMVLAVRPEGGAPWHEVRSLHAASTAAGRARMRLIDPPREVPEEAVISATGSLFETFVLDHHLLLALLLAPVDEERERAMTALGTLTSHAVLQDGRIGVNLVQGVLVAWLLVHRDRLCFDLVDEVVLMCPISSRTRRAFDDLFMFFTRHGASPRSGHDEWVGFDVDGALGHTSLVGKLTAEDLEAAVRQFDLDGVDDFGTHVAPSMRCLVASSEPLKGRSRDDRAALRQRIGWHFLGRGLVLLPWQVQLIDQFARADLLRDLMAVAEISERCPRDFLSYLEHKLARIEGAAV